MGSACLECGIQRQATARLRWTLHCAAIGRRSLGFCARGARRGAASRMTTHFFVQFLLCSESALARLLAKAIVSCSTEAPLPWPSVLSRWPTLRTLGFAGG